ncbi:MAG TPA: DHH family phosphoesterase, partial [Gammaproteobacteria bacterium]|nr:DHH family phosphoesterase [Gammaproteobacteria bacterium]
MPRTIKRRPVPVHDCHQTGLHPVLRRVYAARQITTPHDLDYELGRLPDFSRLGGIEAAVDLLQTAVEGGKRILVVGDYDADGATGSALAILGLRRMGAVAPGYLVPSRFDFGYGLSPEVAELAAGLAPDLLVTVDNGISSLEGIQVVREAGIKTLITDHHLPGPVLPAADAIVNPNLPGDGFPSRNLAGVGVMFYVLAALRARLRACSWFQQKAIPEPNLATLMDLVALGTVADVVPLDHCNRILVAQGLARIRAGSCNPGIKALLRVARRNPARLSASDLGFAVGPRLNAAGRLSDMSLGIECLLCEDESRAYAMAMHLDELNRERREIQQDMQEMADREMALIHADDMPYGLCLYNAAWHQGVVGILASRLKD